MKIILAMVISIDGKTTKWDETNISKWASKEDQQYFADLVKKSEVVIMGSKTFESASPNIKLSPDTLRIIMTKNPEKYSNLEVKNQLEFTNLSPKKILENLKQRDKLKVLLAGGEQINSLFLKEKYVDELWLTIEPKIFGLGKTLLDQNKLELDLKLSEIKQLNDNTIILKYLIAK